MASSVAANTLSARVDLLSYVTGRLFEAVEDIVPTFSSVVLVTIVVVLIFFLQARISMTVQKPAPVPRSIRDVAVIPLCERNLTDWYLSLECALEEGGLVQAIRTPLPEDDPINKLAYMELRLSLPDRFKTLVLNTKVCYDAVRVLKAHLTAHNALLQKEITEEIKEIGRASCRERV